MSTRTPLCLLLAAILAACGSSTADERIGAAEMSVESGDTDDARRGIELLLNSSDTAAMSAAELCRAALVYSALSEDSRSGSEADAAMAARCVRRALRRNPEAVDTFMQALPVEQRARLAMAIQLCSGPSPADIRDYEEADSAAITATHTHSHE